MNQKFSTLVERIEKEVMALGRTIDPKFMTGKNTGGVYIKADVVKDSKKAADMLAWLKAGEQDIKTGYCYFVDGVEYFSFSKNNGTQTFDAQRSQKSCSDHTHNNGLFHPKYAEYSNPNWFQYTSSYHAAGTAFFTLLYDCSVCVNLYVTVVGLTAQDSIKCARAMGPIIDEFIANEDLRFNLGGALDELPRRDTTPRVVRTVA